jgi:hypothetical protein
MYRAREENRATGGTLGNRRRGGCVKSTRIHVPERSVSLARRAREENRAAGGTLTTVAEVTA